MRNTRLLLLLPWLAGAAYAQVAIAPKAGLLHYVEGAIFLDEVRLPVDTWRFPMMRAGVDWKPLTGGRSCC